MTVQAESRGELEVRAARIADYAERSLREFDAAALREDVEERIRNRPITSMLLAVGVGFIIGRLLRS